MSKKKLEPKVILFPTPLVLVTTIGKEGKPNIITVTCIGIASAKPPMVSIGIHPWTHSHKLLEQIGEFAVNIPPEGLLEAVKYCGHASGRDEDKFAGSELTPVEASEIGPPLIGECPVNLECKVTHSLELGLHNLFIGEVVASHVDEAVLDEDGQLDIEKCAAMTCTKGIGEYRATGKLLAMHERHYGKGEQPKL